jgi:hypothetical protein
MTANQGALDPMIPPVDQPKGDLLPCPFCGGPARIVEGDESAYVQCTDMKMHRALWFQGDNNAADEVREQWNRRAVAAGVTEPTEMALLRGPLSKRATSAEFNEWQAREIVAYVDRLRSALTAIPAARVGEVAGWRHRHTGAVVTTIDRDEILARLRPELGDVSGDFEPLYAASPAVTERVQALEEALKPFADWRRPASKLPDEFFRNARVALKDTKP